MSGKFWWERWPSVLKAQREALDQAGIRYSLDDAARKEGILVIHATYPYGGRDLHLDAIFPDFFPFFRFEVKCFDIDLPRHQNPFQKNLCLIGRSTLNWEIDDTLAAFLVQRLPNVILAGSSPEPLGDIEERQAEPFTDYYPYYENILVLFESAWAIDSSVIKGTLELGVASAHLLAILEIRDSSGRVLQTADSHLAHLFKTRIQARWARSPEAIREENAGEFKRKLIDLHPHLARLEYQRPRGMFHNVPEEDLQLELLGVLFPEEVAKPEKPGWILGDGWVFLMQSKRRVVKKGFRPKLEERVFFVRPGRAGHEDMLARIPEVRNLKDKKIALFGLGCLGAPSALDFARSGVGELRILDYDVVDPGIIVRWPLGLQAAGKRKTEAIKSFIEASYPYTKVVHENMRLGEVGELQQARIEAFLEGVDLVYDATAEFGVQYFLSSVALEKGIPYVCLSTTPGAWGGIVSRVVPGKTGCWICLKHWHEEHDRDPSTGIPLPNQDESNGRVQPHGCADPTFTGTSFDTGQIALAGVRLAVSTLLDGETPGYPSFDWDVVVINLRDQDGRGIGIECQTFPLKKNPRCPCANPA